MKIESCLTFMFVFLIWNTMVAQDLIPFERSGLWGYREIDGKEIIKPQYLYAGEFFELAAIVGNGNHFGVINKENKVIIPFKYDYIKRLDRERFLIGHRAEYFGEYDFGVISNENQIIIKPEFAYISTEKGFYKVTQKEDSILGKNEIGDLRSIRTKYGLFDHNGNEVIPCIYDYLSWPEDSLLILSKGDNQALFHLNGKQLTDFKYMVIDNYHEGLSKVREGAKFGYINKEGEVIIPIQFDMCYPFSDGFAIIRIGEHWGAIDKKGLQVIPTKFSLQEVKDKLKREAP